jgi:hypothetical protein
MACSAHATPYPVVAKLRDTIKGISSDIDLFAQPEHRWRSVFSGARYFAYGCGRSVQCKVNFMSRGNKHIIEQIKRVLQAIEPDIAHRLYPVQVLDFQFRHWMVNPATTALVVGRLTSSQS